jgi:2,4-diketo-3-deoxy-L-fuconate hydrolase
MERGKLMRLINLAGRLCLQVDGGAVDVEAASAGRFSADPQRVYAQWDAFYRWAQSVDTNGQVTPFRREELLAPVPAPKQTFAIGLNYAAHAEESGFVKPAEPVVFTKFPSSLTGPVSEVVLPAGGSVDWEVELVVVIGRGGREIPIANAWDHVAGVTVGQDISERVRQHSGPAPQFSLAKSHQGFSPTGPAVVTLDEISGIEDLEIGADIDGEAVQRGRTSQLIFSIPDLIAHLSRIVELYPGDLIFTGTPAGVGAGMTPPRFLQHGERLRSFIEGIGELEQVFVDARTEKEPCEQPFPASVGD